MSQTEVRSIEGIEIPEPGDWQLDPVHTVVEFSARHLMVSKVRGKFHGVSGNIHISDDPLGSWVEVKIDPASVESGDAKRDEHLRSPDFFDVERYPEITFRSTRVEGDTPGGFRLEGDLTVHGVTKPVTLDVEVLGTESDPWGGTRVGFEGTGSISRKEFGIDFNIPMDGGRLLIGDKIDITVTVEAVLQENTPA